MKSIVAILLLAAVASGQFFPPFFPFYPFSQFPYYRFPASEEYAASLGGAKVGLYGKTSGFGGGFGWPYGRLGGSEVTSASLAGAKVGVYGKENPGRGIYY